MCLNLIGLLEILGAVFELEGGLVRLEILALVLQVARDDLRDIVLQ